jgi:predicted transcriptional regulator
MFAICYDSGMTKLLDKAIAKVRELPDEDQDALGAVMLSMIDEDVAVPLDDETRAAIREGLEQARRGEFVPTRKSKLSGSRYPTHQVRCTTTSRNDFSTALPDRSRVMNTMRDRRSASGQSASSAGG